MSDRDEIVARARAFLNSPQLKYQDDQTKHKFLAEKGLSDAEIQTLLNEHPHIPPRTYPQPPPSHLPNLLIGVLRILSWMAGGSALLIFIYHRFLLPRITRTHLARQAIQSHHLSLMQKFTESLRQLKESQLDALSIIPHQAAAKESADFAKCNTLEDVLKESESHNITISDIPLVSLLRCAISEKPSPNTEELFQLLEDKIPWLLSEEGTYMQHKLWETLSTSSLFKSIKSEDADQSKSHTESVRWKYVPPVPSSPSPLVLSLTALLTALPKNTSNKLSLGQHTLQSLTEFTGYLSAQVYAPYRSFVTSGPMQPSGSVAEEEMKKEIRALKGLVLNRRSFMPVIPKVSSSPGPTVTP